VICLVVIDAVDPFEEAICLPIPQAGVLSPTLLNYVYEIFKCISFPKQFRPAITSVVYSHTPLHSTRLNQATTTFYARTCLPFPCPKYRVKIETMSLLKPGGWSTGAKFRDTFGSIGRLTWG